jgi:uncharacterized membrane protein
MSDRVTETTTIAAPADAVRAVLLDFPSYPQWATDLKSVEVIDDSADAPEVRFRAAGMGKSTTYTLKYDLSDPAVVAWKLTDGDITRKLDGQYALTGSGDETTVDYELEVELLVPLPGFIKRRTQGRIMHTALGELKARVEGAS